MLEPMEKCVVFDHTRARFPALVPAGASGFDDLAFLDHQRARPWYGRAVEGARSFSSTGTSGYPKPVPWTPAEDAWYVDEKRDLFAPRLDGRARAFISLAVGHNAGSARAVLEDLGLEVHDAGLSALDDQCAAITAFAPEVLYCSTEIGTIAYSCGTCGAYHFLDGLYPEAAPAEVADSRDLIGGEAGAVVLAVSSVKRTSFPVVRFVTYDVVRGLRRGTCGGARRFTCERVLGRCDDVVNYGELFSCYDLGDLIGSRLPAARWFVFNPWNDLTIVIEGLEPAGFREELRSRYPLHSRMSDLGLLDPPEIRFVGDFDAFTARAGLPASRRGKAARRVQRRTPESSWFEEPAR